MPPDEAIRTLDQAAAWLEGLLNVEKEPGVDYARLDVGPVRRLLERLGEPPDALSVIHIAGSKGKGSTALFAESILRAAGEKVGTFTSPHLERWTERFRIDGEAVAAPRLAAVVDRLRPCVDALRREDPARAPTFFDATTAAALVLFRESGVDRAVLEVGLGGRLDSTNVVTPAVACVTSIELEHTDKLGNTLAEIAFEKAGILKPGVPVAVGQLPDEARQVVASRARELGCPVAWLGRDFGAFVLRSDADGLSLRLWDGPVEVVARLPVLGAHQAGNAALALACARRAGAAEAEVLAEAARRGLAGASLPGRAELLRRRPWVLVDSAHTAASAQALAAVLGSLPGDGVHFVLSISAAKDCGAILAALLPRASRVTVTRAEPTRSLAPDVLAEAVRAAAPALPLRVVPDPQRALRSAAEGLGESDLLCATGSVYLAGIARRVLRDPQPDPDPHPAAGGQRSPGAGGSGVVPR